MPNASTETTTRRHALIMLAYAAVLTLGAALPIAASENDSIARRSEGGIESGGYRRELGTTDTGVEATKAERPRDDTAEITPITLEVSIPASDDASERTLPSIDSRGS